MLDNLALAFAFCSSIIDVPRFKFDSPELANDQTRADFLVICSSFPTQIISKDLSDPVRSHKDLDKDAAPYFKKAVQFYEELAKQLVSRGHVVDLFASALDQVCICSLCLFLRITTR